MVGKLQKLSAVVPLLTRIGTETETKKHEIEIRKISKFKEMF